MRRTLSKYSGHSVGCTWDLAVLLFRGLFAEDPVITSSVLPAFEGPAIVDAICFRLRFLFTFFESPLDSDILEAVQISY